MKKESLSRCITIAIRALFGIALFTCLVILINYATRHKGEGLIPENVRTISNWIYKTESGDTIASKTPILVDVPVGETVVFKTVLPNDIVDGDYIATSNSKNITIEIDGDTRYEWEREQADVPGGPTHATYMFVPVYSKDSGKEILVTKYGNTFNGGFEPFVLGDAWSVINYYKKEAGSGQFLIAIFLFIISILIIICGFVISVVTKRDMYLIAAGFAVMTASAWLVFDSMEFQLYFGIKHIDGFIAYIFAMLIPFPFLAFIDSIQTYRYRNYYSMLAITELINLIVCTSLHLTGTVNFHDVLLFMNGIMGVVIVGAFTCTFYDVVVVKVHTYRRVSIGLLVFMILGFLEVLFIQFDKPWVDGLFLELGLFVVLITAVSQQIIDIMTMEQERQLTYKANEARSEFLTNMSHEIRTPINAILGMNEMIMQENHSSVIKEYSEHIGQAGQVLLSLVNDILDYSTIQKGDDFIECVDYDTRSMLDNVTSVLREKAEEKGLDVSINVSDSLPECLYGDARHIVRVLKNISSNAVKFTRVGEISFDVECREDSVNGGYILEFYIKDSGIGIRKEDIDKLFSAFNRIDIKKNRSLDGAGLGLAISRSLVEAMNGTIEVKSVFGEGSTFIITIPQKKAKNNAIIPANEDTKIQESQGVYDDVAKGAAVANSADSFSNISYITNEAANDRENVINDWEVDSLACYSTCFEAPNAKILAVDDNSTNLIVVREFLKETKINLETVTNGDEAIKLCKEKKYDIILMDHMMPEPDGVETMHTIRESLESINRKTTILVLTANVIGDCKNEYIQEGFDGYLSKPVERSHLLRTVRKYLDDKLVTDIEESIQENTESVIEEAQNEEVATEIFSDKGIIDFEGLFMRFEGQKEVAKMILLECVKEGERKIVLLRELFESNDIERYGIEAHGVKGVMASVCIDDFSAHAREHEFAAKEGRVDYIKDDIDSFLSEYRQVLDYISDYLKSEGIEVTPSVAVSYDGTKSTPEEFIACIRRALDDFDVDEALKHIAGLLEVVSEDKKSIVEEIMQYTDDFEYDKALECLDRL